MNKFLVLKVYRHYIMTEFDMLCTLDICVKHASNMHKHI